MNSAVTCWVWISMSVSSCLQKQVHKRSVVPKKLLNYKGWMWKDAALETGNWLSKLVMDKIKIKRSPTFNFWHKAKALLEVRADAVEAPAELGVAAVLVGAAGVVTHIQLIAAFGHGRDAHVHLEHNKGDECVCLQESTPDVHYFVKCRLLWTFRDCMKIIKEEGEGRKGEFSGLIQLTCSYTAHFKLVQLRNVSFPAALKIWMKCHTPSGTGRPKK